jgi:hypothetical protein
MKDLLQQNQARVTRRALFGSTAGGVGTAALALRASPHRYLGPNAW